MATETRPTIAEAFKTARRETTIHFEMRRPRIDFKSLAVFGSLATVPTLVILAAGHLTPPPIEIQASPSSTEPLPCSIEPNRSNLLNEIAVAMQAADEPAIAALETQMQELNSSVPCVNISPGQAALEEAKQAFPTP